MSKSIFITATGTGVGKTFVSGLICKKLCDGGHKVGYYKPVASDSTVCAGELVPDDVNYVKHFVPLPYPIQDMYSYAYKHSVSPHLASQLEANPVEIGKIIDDFNTHSKAHDYLVVEGCGGIVCPIRYDTRKQLFLVDIIQQLNLGVLIVASAALGTLNATVLTVEFLRQKNIHIRGIIINQFREDNVMDRDNVKMMRLLTQVPIIAQVEANARDLSIKSEDLLPLFE